MKVSVIIPTYNRKEILRHCLTGVTNRDYPDYEVIVVDDGSTDGTGEMVQQEFPQVRYIRQDPNQGPAAARNRGIEVAMGEIVAFTDDDCEPPADWLQSLSEGFQRHPEVSGVGGYPEATPDALRSNIFARYEAYVVHDLYRVGNEPYVGSLETPGCGTNNVAYRADVLREVNGFDQSFPYAASEDADLKKRVTEAGHLLLYLPIKVSHHHEFNWGSFRRQQVTRGRGVVHFERKHEGAPPTRLRILLRAAKRGLWFWRDLLRAPDPRLALLRLLAGWFDCYGQWLELSRLRQTGTSNRHEQGYFRSPRTDLAELVPATANHILDVGCGEGLVGAMLKAQAGERYVVGIELDPEAARRARSRLDKVYQGNVQEAQLDEPPASFDCLIYGDVLEHLIEPLEVLQRHRPLLREAGHVVVSLPNVQFYYVLWSLLRGRWPYTDRGIFDRGHLRFFTLREIQRLLSNAGYRVVSVRRNYRLLERPSKINQAAACVAWLPPLRPFLTYQYLLLAQKTEVAVP